MGVQGNEIGTEPLALGQLLGRAGRNHLLCGNSRVLEKKKNLKDLREGIQEETATLGGLTEKKEGEEEKIWENRGGL